MDGAASGFSEKVLIRFVIDRELVLTAATSDILGMDLLPDAHIPPANLKISPEERRRRTAARLIMIRLKMAIGRKLEERSITRPAEIGAALRMAPVEATKLLTWHQWREGAVEQLETVAARLGVQVSEPASSAWSMYSAPHLAPLL